jgi:hypothetical protein
LTLEVNTLVTTGLSAQKMPEEPLALHTLVQGYGDYLATCGFQISQTLLIASNHRVMGDGGPDGKSTPEELLRELQAWPFDLRRFTDAEKKAGLDKIIFSCDTNPGPALELTNGAETFEALQWAAWAAAETMRAGGMLPNNPDASVLSRIYANCRQLKEAALRLENQHSSRSGLKAFFETHILRRSQITSKVRLRNAVDQSSTGNDSTKARLFGGTIEQTARALFQHPRPAFEVDPDVTILIRKAWDIGVKRVCLQTVMQVDGDVLQVVGDLRPEERDFLTLLHKQAVKESVTQWKAMFDLILKLAGEVGRVVFKG